MKVIEKDLYRFYGEKGESLHNKIFCPREIKYLKCLRRCQKYNNKKIISLFFRFLLRKISYETKIQIPYETKIDAGFYIGHCGCIIINKNAILGKNINIATGVTIGQENRGKRKGSPTIGNNCWIGTNAVIVGKVTIGSDVLIAPLSFVNFDVPDHSLVIGNPARIIPMKNATKDYLHNLVD